MSLKMYLFFAFFTLVLYSAANAFNVTQLLNQYSDFSNFNNYLTQTGLASQINSRQTITLLVVDNSATSPLSGKPNNVLKNIMSVHVVLDYYDVKKLQNLPNKTHVLTTLFQSSGLASGQQGFLNATDLSSGSVVIGSAVKGATLRANLVKSVASQPYNISVLQISNVIIPFGIDNSNQNSSSSSSSPSPMPSSPPAPTPKKSPPAPTPKKSPPPAATPAPASSDAPGSPLKPEGPTADAPADDKKSSGGTALRLSVGVAMVLVSWTNFFLTSIV